MHFNKPGQNYTEAVALEYGRHKAPVVTAKGEDDLAHRIVAEAQKQGVYVAEDPRLLAMLSQLDVGQEIPQDMFTAVAVILAWVYWLKGMQPGDERKQDTAGLRSGRPSS
jgi:flagellar biosynthesis protein